MSSEGSNPRRLVFAWLAGLWLVCLAGCSRADPEFIKAAKEGKTDLITVALADGRAADTAEPSGYTALMRASEWGRLDIARLLIDSGADVNHKARDNVSPLTLAGKKDRGDVVRLLLEVRSRLE